MATGTTKNGTKIISAEEFVVAFAECETMEQMEQRTGWTRGKVMYRAAQLRKRGVQLPVKFKAQGGGKRLDVAALNALYEQHTQKPAEQPVKSKGGKAK